MNNVIAKIEKLDPNYQEALLKFPIINIGDSSLSNVLYSILTYIPYIEKRINLHGHPNPVIQDYADALEMGLLSSPDKIILLKHFKKALELSADILIYDPGQLYEQLYARMKDDGTSCEFILKQMPRRVWVKLRNSLIHSTNSLIIRSIYGAESVSCCSISRDGELGLIGGKNGSLGVYNLESGQLQKGLGSGNENIHSCGLTSNGKIAMSSSTEGINIWSTETGEIIKSSNISSTSIKSSIMDRMGNYVVSIDKGRSLILWSLKRKKCHFLAGHTDTISCCDISEDGKLAVSGSYDETIRVWDLGKKECIMVIPSVDGALTGICLSKDSTVVAAISTRLLTTGEVENYDIESGDFPIRIYPEERGANFIEQQKEIHRGFQKGPENHNLFDTLLALFKLAGISDFVAGKDHIQLYSTIDGKKFGNINSSGDYFGALKFSYTNDRLFSLSNNGRVQIWDITKLKKAATLNTGLRDISSIDNSWHNSRIILGSSNGKIQIWRDVVSSPSENNRNQDLLISNTSLIYWFHFDEENSSFWYSADSTIINADLETLVIKEKYQFKNRPGMVAYDFSIAALLWVYNSIERGRSRCQLVLNSPEDEAFGRILVDFYPIWITKLSINKEGTKVIACLSDFSVKCIETSTKEILWTKVFKRGLADFCMLSTEGVIGALVIDKKTLILFDISGAIIKEFFSNEGEILQVNLSSNGAKGVFLLLKENGNQLVFWDIDQASTFFSSELSFGIPKILSCNSSCSLALIVFQDSRFSVMEVSPSFSIKHFASFSCDFKLNACKLSNSGKFIVGGDDLGRLYFWEICNLN